MCATVAAVVLLCSVEVDSKVHSVAQQVDTGDVVPACREATPCVNVALPMMLGACILAV